VALGPPSPKPSPTARAPRARPVYQFGRAYELGARPRPVIPARGAVRFAMQLAIPALACPTAKLDVTWTGGPPAYLVAGPQTSFTVQVRG
jgi:hypothetical protein